jgi:hypothetical protein
MTLHRLVCGYCSREATDLSVYDRKQYGDLVAMQQHLMLEHGLTLADLQQHIRRDPTGTSERGVYHWYLTTDNSLCLWSEEI